MNGILQQAACECCRDQVGKAVEFQGQVRCPCSQYGGHDCGHTQAGGEPQRAQTEEASSQEKSTGPSGVDVVIAAIGGAVEEEKCGRVACGGEQQAEDTEDAYGASRAEMTHSIGG